MTGLLTVDGQPKPWACEFRKLAGDLAGGVGPAPKLGARPALNRDAAVTSLKAAQAFRSAYLAAYRHERDFPAAR